MQVGIDVRVFAQFGKERAGKTGRGGKERHRERGESGMNHAVVSNQCHVQKLLFQASVVPQQHCFTIASCLRLSPTAVGPRPIFVIDMLHT